MRGGMLGRGGVLDGGRSGVVGRELGGVWIWGGGVYLGGTLPEQDVEGWGKGVLGEGRSGVAGREFGGVGIECGEGWLGGTLPGWGGEGCGEGVLEWGGGGCCMEFVFWVLMLWVGWHATQTHPCGIGWFWRIPEHAFTMWVHDPQPGQEMAPRFLL